MTRKRYPPLPATASRYIKALEASLRPSTCYGYRMVLGMWHRWADSVGVVITEMTREDVVLACTWLHERGLSPGTRAGNLLKLRGYLRYLSIHEDVEFDPDRIFHNSDIPRIPDRLPRALRPDVDAELRRRLVQSSEPAWLGLLLMRKTGVRVGELLSLPYDCIHEDEDGNQFLKVPLGKLYNERLVPIDTDTKAIIESIQKQMVPPPRPWLLQFFRGRPVCYKTIVRTLRSAIKGLEGKESEPITSHRLRHTYATELLNAGMSLASLQQVLGHRSINMTLHYARLNLNTLATEYNDALAKTHERYQACLPDLATEGDLVLSIVVADAARQLIREAGECVREKRTKLLRLARRLTNLGAQIAQFGL